MSGGAPSGAEPTQSSGDGLKRSLGVIHLWGLAVGMVISGDYFGWNLGLSRGGPVGMIIATLAVTVLYVCFIFSYTELAAAIPHSGGPSAFAKRAFGSWGAYVAGAATLIEFLFAPPAIARAVGAYVNFRAPSLSVNAVSVGAFVLFGAINAMGVSLAATLELVITLLATFELGLFFVLTAPHVQTSTLLAQPLLPGGVGGVFACVPFAIWFYLGLEGAAMSAEEVIEPKKTIPRGFLAAIATLVTLALGVLVCTSGAVPWRELVADDSPLPKVLSRVLSRGHAMTHLMVYLGLLGLLASFHGIVLGCSRQVFALARDGVLPATLARVHPKRRTPVAAILLSCSIGVAATLSGKTDALITMSVLGALVLYVTSMFSALKLRKSEPDLERPFVAPLHPVLPIVAIALSCVAFASVAWSAPWVCAAFVAVMVVGGVVFGVAARSKRESNLR
ncbi:MAG: ethanolamine permease [Myxococcales bacterium]|nr:ethanolamine permease [Myxococcales bacterium]